MHAVTHAHAWKQTVRKSLERTSAQTHCSRESLVLSNNFLINVIVAQVGTVKIKMSDKKADMQMQ